jgi:uncharacterized protein (TIRG00374 family)
MRRRPLAALLAVALLAAFVLVLGPERVARDLSRADPRLVALACLSTLGSLLCWSEAQRRLHGAAGATTGPGAFGVAYATGVFLKLTLPGGRAGGPAVMAYALGRETRLGFERDLTAVLAGKFVGFLGCVPPALAGLLFVTLPFPVGRALLPATAGLTAVVGVTAVVLVRRPGTVRAVVHRLAGLGRATVGRLSERAATRLSHSRVDAACDRAGHTLAAIRGDRRALASAFVLTALGWCLAAGPLYFAFAALEVPVPLALALFVVPAGTVANGVPLPGGIGGVEFALTGLLVAVTGLPVATVGAAVLLYRATGDGVSALLGGAAVTARPDGRRRRGE